MYTIYILPNIQYHLQYLDYNYYLYVIANTGNVITKDDKLGK